MKGRLFLATATALLLFSSAHGAGPTRFEYEQPQMGTKFRIVLYAPDKATADLAAKAGFARVAELNGIMSDYVASSELMQLCKKFEEKSGAAVKVGKDLFFVLEKAQEVSKLSDGAFDVTVRPLVVLWRQARRTQKLPGADELAAAKALVGYRNIELDPKEQTVKLKIPGMQIDLGGIAKGYAADEVLKTLAQFKITTSLVAAGGDIAVSGAPPGTGGWKIDIAPLPGDNERRVLQLKDGAVSTSGDAEQFVVIDGIRYSHIVDPKTGLGLTGRRSVTVIARRGISADSLTKMASIFPPDKAIELIDKMEATATLIVRKTDKGEEVFASKRFKDYLLTPGESTKK
jgi:thiamine biosynthesis lipoprotein